MSRLGNYSELDYSPDGPLYGNHDRLLAVLILNDAACPGGSHRAYRLERRHRRG